MGVAIWSVDWIPTFVGMARGEASGALESVHYTTATPTLLMGGNKGAACRQESPSSAL